MVNVTGLSGAAPIWNAVMRKSLEGLPPAWYERPPAVVDRAICVPSGLLPTPTCQSQRNEIFVAGTEPTLPDNIWQAFEVDSESGKLAGPGTPPERRKNVVFQMLPQEAADWVRENGIAQPPTGRAAFSLDAFDPDTAIITPTLNGYVTGVIDIGGNARGGPYRVEFGSGPDPQQWTQIGPEHGEEVANGRLESLDTYTLGEGIYTLRLTVQRGDGPREWRTPITVDHTEPTVVISEPKPDRLYVMEDDEQINVNVLVNDTWAVERVVYYVNGAEFATSTVAPYNERWKIKMRDIGQIETGAAENWLGFTSDDPDIQPGRMLPFGDGFQAIRTSAGVYLESYLFKVRAYDGAGNMAESDEVRVYVRHKK
jgi:membrane carboxypeptidase/penicillin-binding protein PbpC